jgi:hypothetical protein
MINNFSKYKPAGLAISGWLFLCLLSFSSAIMAQTPDTIPPAAEEEDYSIYDNVAFTDANAKRFCSPKIFDLSPQRFISVSWDAQLPYDVQLSERGSFAPDADLVTSESGGIGYTGGLRLGANIPVVSRNNIVWQMGFNYWETRYNMQTINETGNSAGLLRILDERGLKTMGLNTTVFKPLGEKTFLLFQGSADLSGNYTFSDFQSLNYMRYSAALMWGKRPNDRKMWAVGAARTYRVGEMNYIPIVLFNYTSPNRKWGTEILFPARAHVRRTINPRSLMLAGFELEGQSYRIGELSDAENSFELRRGEMRIRIEYQRQISGFVWMSAQVGLRNDMSFNSDALPNDGREFFRGFFGDQLYAMQGAVSNPLYFNIGVHLVSP